MLITYLRFCLKIDDDHLHNSVMKTTKTLPHFIKQSILLNILGLDVGIEIISPGGSVFCLFYWKKTS